MIKAVIFDMDGLMINSERVTFEGYQKVMKDMDLTMSEDFYIKLLGKTLKGVTELFYEEYSQDFPLNDVIVDVHEYMNNRFENEGVPIKKGLIELLTYLKENHYQTIVATSSTRKRVDHILELANLTQYFDNSICGDEVAKGKPNPDIFLKACEKLNVKPNEALVLEDSEAGIHAAHQAHIPVICIPDMKYPEPFYQEMTTSILSSLDQVINYLNNENQ